MGEIIIDKSKVGVDEVVDKTIDLIGENRKARIKSAIKDPVVFTDNAKVKKGGHDGFTQGRNMRHIARIPHELYVRAKEIWGDDVFTNKKKFKKYFLQDEVGAWTLRVPKNTI